MFCDLADSTRLTRQLDPEQLRELIHSFHHCCRERIASFHGYLARYMGDGLLAYFGYPHASELDPERALHAGLSILESWRQQRPIDAALRIGVETGQVIAGDVIGQGSSEEHEVLGDTPNLAARLQGIAPTDSLIIGPGCAAITSRRFELEPLKAQILKGFEQPIKAYRVKHAINVTPPTQQKSLLIGRQLELTELEQQLEDPSRLPLALIEGIAGIGKSRLLEHLLNRLAGRYNRASLHCSPFFSDQPLYPLHQYWQRPADDSGRAQ